MYVRDYHVETKWIYFLIWDKVLTLKKLMSNVK